MKIFALAIVSASLCWAGTSVAQPAGKLAYPAAKRDNTVDVYFGTKVPAPYQWMENLESPELHKWVAAENRITETYLAGIPVRSWINQRLTQLWNYPKQGTPEQLKNGMLFSGAIPVCRTSRWFTCRLRHRRNRGS